MISVKGKKQRSGCHQTGLRFMKAQQAPAHPEKSHRDLPALRRIKMKQCFLIRVQWERHNFREHLGIWSRGGRTEPTCHRKRRQGSVDSGPLWFAQFICNNLYGNSDSFAVCAFLSSWRVIKYKANNVASRSPTATQFRTSMTGSYYMNCRYSESRIKQLQEPPAPP